MAADIALGGRAQVASQSARIPAWELPASPHSSGTTTPHSISAPLGGERMNIEADADAREQLHIHKPILA